MSVSTNAKSTVARKPAAKRASSKTTPADLYNPANIALREGVERMARPQDEILDGDKVTVGSKGERLAVTPPSDLHQDLAKWLEKLTGIEFTPDMVKAVQLTAVLRIDYQKSNWNKTRDSYRGLEAEVCDKRSEHMIAAHQEARVLIQQRVEAAAKAAAKPARRTPAKKAAPAAKAS